MRDSDFLLDIYTEMIEMWEGFCKNHSALYEKTCDEYIALLKSDLDLLEQILADKKEFIDAITLLEERRQKLINKLNRSLSDKNKVSTVSDLLNIMNSFEKSNGANVLSRLNALLVDIIEKIKEQSKQNQIFLNKALRSIRQIKDGFLGKKTYETYTSAGMVKTINTRG